MSNEHAMRFPLVGSAMLLSLFLLFKFLSKDLVNAVLTCYFFVLGIVALSYVPSVWVILLCLILVADWWFGVILHYLLIYCPFHTLQSDTFTCNQTFFAKAVERGPYNLAFSVFSLYVVPPFSLDECLMSIVISLSTPFKMLNWHGWLFSLCKEASICMRYVPVESFSNPPPSVVQFCISLYVLSLIKWNWWLLLNKWNWIRKRYLFLFGFCPPS